MKTTTLSQYKNDIVHTAMIRTGNHSRAGIERAALALYAYRDNDPMDNEMEEIMINVASHAMNATQENPYLDPAAVAKMAANRARKIERERSAPKFIFLTNGNNL